MVHVWTINHSPYALKMIAKVYENSGRKFRPVDPTSLEVMQQAGKLCSGRECVPMTAMVGATLKDIESRREPGEITIYINVDQQGPCQNGAWPLVWESFIKRKHLKNVVAGVWPGPENNRLGLGVRHTMAVDACLFLADAFMEAEFTLRCLALDGRSALARFESAFRRFLDTLKPDDKAVKQALYDWADSMAGIPLKTPVEDAPKVLIFGGLNLLFVHEPVTDYFLSQGILPKVVDFFEGASWIGSESMVRYGLKKGLIRPREQFSFSPSIKDGHEALHARTSKLALKLMDSIQKEFRSIMGKSGLLFDAHIPFHVVAEKGHPYVSYNAFTETSPTTGRYICSVEGGLYDGLVNLGSFNCQPAMNSQAVIRPLANRHDIPYIAIDCEGPWLSTNQRRLLESMAVQARRVKEKKLEECEDAPARIAAMVKESETGIIRRKSTRRADG
jgi:predicted nucleotide-binding protein (sugar kinase/HSP70/actin superfamily)